MELISDNPQDINSLAEKFIGKTDVESRVPSDHTVELPGGFINADGSLTKVVTVRELNGADEEVIVKTGNRALMLNAILTRGLDKIGYRTPTSTDFDNLLAGDRDAIILGIRKVTFGETVDGQVVCPSCGHDQDLIIDLNNDIEIKELADPISDRTFEVSLRAGKAMVGLPNGITQRKMYEAAGKTTAELTTILLGSCLISIDDEPSKGSFTASSLGLLDRETLTNEITSRSPGPRLGAVIKACEACEEPISIPLSLADLFRL